MISRTMQWCCTVVLGVVVVAVVPGRSWAQNNENGSSGQLGEAASLNEESLRLREAGQYDKAVPLAERALSIVEKALGPNHPDVATSLNNLAMLYDAKGDYDRAESLYQRALRIREDALGPHHRDVAQSLNNLALLYKVRGDYAHSEPLYVRALAIREKVLGPDHPDVATVVNNLGSLYEAKGRYARAEPLYQRALTIWEKVLGPDHPRVAIALSNLALLHHAMGDYKHEEPELQRVLRIMEMAAGPNHPHVATALSNLAGLYAAKADYARAEPLLLRALGIHVNVLGPNHPHVALLLEDLAKLYKEKGDYPRAEPLLVRALNICEATFGPNHYSVAHALGNLADLYTAKGDYTRAEQLYQRALRISENVRGPDHLDVAIALNSLGGLHEAKGNYGRAEQLLQRALSILEKALGPDHPSVALTLNNVALLQVEQGDYMRPEPLYQRALSIQEKALGPDHPNVARTIGNLANLNQAKGDYAQAELLHQRAFNIFVKAQGPNHLDVATALNNLAGLHMANGDFARAEPFYVGALNIREAALGPSHCNVANSLQNLAHLYMAKGDNARAEQLLHRALSILEEVLGPDHPHVAVVLSNLAGLYGKKRDYSRAEPLFHRALNIREIALGRDHPDTATSLNNLAGLYDAIGDYARAETNLLRALSIDENALGPRHPKVAMSLNNLAGVYEAQGDHRRAESLYLRALGIAENALGPGHSNMAIFLENLSNIYWTRGNIDSTLSLIERAAAIRDAHATRQLAVGTADQRRLYMDTLRGDTESTVSFHVQWAARRDDAKRLAFRTILRRKGLTLDAMANSFINLRERLFPEGQTKFDHWRTLTAQYSAMVQRGPDKQGINTFRASLQSVNEARQKVESELSFLSKDLQIQLELTSIEHVQAAIPPDAALVELFRYHSFNPTVKAPQHRWDSPRYVVYVLHPSGRLDHIDLGAAKPIEDAVKAFRLALSTDARDPKPAGRDLYQRVMGPIIKLLGQTKHVYLSPDGALNLVPFGAMLAPDDHYVVENLAISYLSTGRDLTRAPSRSAQQPSAVFSAPNYEAGDTSKPRAERSFGLLRAGPAEGRAVLEKLTKAMLFAGPAATESALKTLHGPKVVHISTHGFFDNDLPALHEPHLQSFDMLPQPSVENALLRSGLALAGANRGGVDKEDGILTALEASQLDLWGTKLVVLSACDTGRGQVENGDGIYGLRRAFTIAGAETVMMSLWKVDADATTELVTQYYDGLSKGGGRAEALRQAQLGMLADAKRSHPHYWASFIVSGNDAAIDGQPVEPTFGRINRSGTCGACEIGTHELSGSGVWIGMAIIGAALRLQRRGIRVENRQ